MSQTGSDSGSPPIPTPPDSPQSTASHQSRHSTISRRSHSHTSDRDRRLATLENELRQSSLTRDRLVRERDHLDLQVHQLRSNIRDMEVFQHGQRDDITRLETEIWTLTHAMGDDPEDLHTQVLQLRTERNDFERNAISAREDLHNAETDLDRLRLEAIQAGDEIRDLQAQISNLEREPDDARVAPLVLSRVSVIAPTEDRDRALSDRDSALRLRDHAVAARDQVHLDLLTETTRTAQLDDDLEVVRQELQEREREISDLQVTHDQLTVLRDLAESDLNEADLFLTQLASRVRESQATQMPKRGRSPPTSPPQLQPSKISRSDRPVSPPPNQDQSEIEGMDDQEHQDQHEFGDQDGQELRDQSEIEGQDDQEHQDQSEIDDQEHKDQSEIAKVRRSAYSSQSF
ncbi:hypothetical protein PHMEG_00035208 [Phytophthora megakarya]|uniref:Uncharacterized protein n=1 Tax=Phytophthora megakarya TaxID=4795 RepID=A0A225UQW4_9STRA|nr:hypothetical protein PHMEG_00035208 [Phytophthora megakarya]